MNRTVTGLILALMLTPVLAHEEIQEDEHSKACEIELKDQIFIVRLNLDGATTEQMRTRATNSREELGEEHYKSVMTLIDEADKAISKGAIEDWLNGYWKTCINKVST